MQLIYRFEFRQQRTAAHGCHERFRGYGMEIWKIFYPSQARPITFYFEQIER